MEPYAAYLDIMSLRVQSEAPYALEVIFLPRTAVGQAPQHSRFSTTEAFIRQYFVKCRIIARSLFDNFYLKEKIVIHMS